MANDDDDGWESFGCFVVARQTTNEMEQFLSEFKKPKEE